MIKKNLRSVYKIRRDSLSDESFSLNSSIISNAILSLPIWHLDYFHIFLPISQQKEIDTNLIISSLRSQGKKIVVPKIVGKGELSHYLLTNTTKFNINAWNIPEPVDGTEIKPQQIDVVFIPLLAFDLIGNRVGYGKGFYDKFLGNCEKDVIKIGLSLFEAEDIIEDIDEFDVPLDYCVTPKKTYSF